MADLIRIAWGLNERGFGNDKILGGPNWLELDRFEVIAKVPANSTAEIEKQMLQAPLEYRCGLPVHTETKPLPGYALTVGKKPQLKEADGSGESGCKAPRRSSGIGSERRLHHI